MKSTIDLLTLKVKNNVDDIISQSKIYQYELFLGICTLLLACVIGNWIKKSRRNFPPGPVGLPIVGYLPFLSKIIHLDFIELGKEYGDVFSVRLGMLEVVVLHGAEAIKEAFSKTEFLGRPPNSVLSFVFPSSPFFDGDFHLWKEQRRFVVKSLNDLGLGKAKIEQDLLNEIDHFLEILRSQNGQPIDVKMPLSSSVSNNICALVFGKRYEYDDSNRRFLDDTLNERNKVLTQTSSITLFPWIRFIPFFSKLLQINAATNPNNRLKLFIRNEVEKHIQTIEPGNIRDFIDSYLMEIKSKQTEDMNTTFSHKMLVNNVLDFFSAGSETVRTAILWYIYTVASFPDVQKKLHDEIFEVLGSERNPQYSDLKRMPYMHAVIVELMRWKTILPINLTRYTLADTKVGGYDIPKGTTVMANFWNAHHDPRYWTEPDEFKPERFLSEDGKSVVKSEYFMPFSLGRRVCPGETMAYMEMFLYFTSMLQKFDILFPEHVKPTFDSVFNITYKVKPFAVRFVPKN